MGKIFGTDGVRGIANTELSCERAMQIGRAAAMVLTEATHRKPVVLIGKDPRLSSDMLESAITSGLCSVGADVCLLGVVPTPAVAYLVERYGADAGVMISASHNPCEYNGIKIFNAEGYKLPDALEDEIESIVLTPGHPIPRPVGREIGRVTRVKTAASDYLSHITATISTRFDGFKVALDCANGSASVTARDLFTTLGAEVVMLGDQPNGININASCGSTCLDPLIRAVREHGCHLGLAFDGDADRCLAVDEHGSVVDGDKLIAIFARAFKGRGSLDHDTVVVTVMSNFGFFRFCEACGIATHVTGVGDRYVLEAMLSGGFALGGEQSGHIIFRHYATTGDGQLTGVQLLAALTERGESLSQAASLMKQYPQVLLGVQVSDGAKERFLRDDDIQAALKESEAALGGDGRVLVRPSGTEPLIRIMVEGSDYEIINHMAHDLSSIIQARLCP